MIRARSAPPSDPEQGTALILAVLLGILAVGLAVSGSRYLEIHRSKTEATFVLAGQSGELAHSGLTRAVDWFRQQVSQPVLSFDPAREDLVTEEPEIGLVRSCQIDGSLWGRFEIWKQWDADPVSSRLRRRRGMQATDVSHLHNAAPGSVWRLRCAGYLYRRMDPDRAFDEAPNKVLGTEIHEAEIRRLVLAIPAAALSVRQGATIGTNGVADEQGTAPLEASGDIGGTSEPTPGIPDHEGSVRQVFGTSPEDLRALADIAVTDQDRFPSPVPDKAFVYSESQELVLAGPGPLVGFGIVYHAGNLTLEAGTDFSGLLYVDGDLTISCSPKVRGSVIATGKVYVNGAGDLSNLVYDADVVAALQEAYGQYRFSTPVRISN